MVAQIKELKTNKTAEKERILSYLDYLRDEVKSDKIDALICITDDTETIHAEVLGDIDVMTAIGMFDTAKLCYQMGSFEPAE